MDAHACIRTCVRVCVFFWTSSPGPNPYPGAGMGRQRRVCTAPYYAPGETAASPGGPWVRRVSEPWCQCCFRHACVILVILVILVHDGAVEQEARRCVDKVKSLASGATKTYISKMRQFRSIWQDGFPLCMSVQTRTARRFFFVFSHLCRTMCCVVSFHSAVRHCHCLANRDAQDEKKIRVFLT